MPLINSRTWHVSSTRPALQPTPTRWLTSERTTARGCPGTWRPREDTCPGTKVPTWLHPDAWHLSGRGPVAHELKERLRSVAHAVICRLVGYGEDAGQHSACTQDRDDRIWIPMHRRSTDAQERWVLLAAILSALSSRCRPSEALGMALSHAPEPIERAASKRAEVHSSTPVISRSADT